MTQTMFERLSAGEWRGLAANRYLWLVLLTLAAVVAGFQFSAAPHWWLIVAVVLALALGSLQRNALATYTMLFVLMLVPFGVLPFSLAGITLSIVEVTLLSSLGLWLLRMLLDRDAELNLTWTGLALVVFVGVTAVAFINGSAHAFSFSDLRLFLRGAIATTAFFLALNTLQNELEVRLAAVTIAVGGALAALVALWLFLQPPRAALAFLNHLVVLGYPMGDDLLRFHVESERLRAIGTSIDPNALGALMMIAFLCCLGPLLSPVKASRWRWLYLAPVVLTAAALLLSLSRSSWLGAAAGASLLLMLRYRLLRPLAAIALLAAVLGFLLGFDAYLERLPMVGRYLSHLVMGLRAEDQATLMRLGEYKDALTLISRYPFLGVGYGGSPTVDLYVGVSSLYLLLAENAGLLGLALYLLTIASGIIYSLVRLRHRLQADLSWLALGCLAAVFAAMVAGVFDQPFINPSFAHLSVLFWFVLGLAMCSSQLVAKQSASPTEEG